MDRSSARSTPPDEPAPTARPRQQRLTTGYFECTRRIERLKKFQDLIRHKERYAGHLEFARPLEELIGKHENVLAPLVLDREINRLIPIVHSYLLAIGLGLALTLRIPVEDYNDSGQLIHRMTERKLDLIRSYFDLPHSQYTYEKIMGLLDQGIGFYEARSQRAFWELFNPLIWLAWILKTPLFVLEHAGFPNFEGRVFGAYAWTVRILMLFLIGGLAARVWGIPSWDAILRLLQMER